MGDLDDLVALHAAPEVAQFMRTLPRERAIERIAASDEEWRDRGHGLLAIVERDSRRFLGRTGLRYWPEFGETEIGWALHPEHWGRGYATEAASAVLGWAFRAFDLEYLTAMIRPDNLRSSRVAEQLGMTPIREDVLRGIPVLVYAIRRGRG